MQILDSKILHDFSSEKKSKIFIFFVFLVHMFLPLNWGDDKVFFKLYQSGYEKFMLGQTRTLVGSLTFIFSKLPILWRVLNPFILILLLVVINRIINLIYHKKGMNFFSVFVLYPAMVLVDAGFMATTVNYLWTMTFGLTAVYISLKDFYGQKTRWYEWLLGSLVLVYSVNSEQMVVILLMIFFVMIFVCKMKNPMVLLEFGICIAGILYDFYSNFFKDNPRFEREVSRYFETFPDLNVVEKFELGFSSTFFCLSMKICVVSIPFILFLIYLVYVTVKRYDEFANRLPSVTLLIITIILVLLSAFPNNRIYKFLSGGYVNYKMGMAHYSFSLVPDIIFLLILVLLLMSIYLIVYDSGKKAIVFLAFVCGLFSRIMMGFSPTVWASGHRTFSVFMMSLIFIGIVIQNENQNVFNKQQEFEFVEC